MVSAAGKRYLWSPDGVRHYVRRKGKYTAIQAPLGTEAFDREYWAILGGKAVARTSWAALIDSYCKSDRWLHLKTRTRQDYQRVLDYLTEKNATRDVTKARRVDVLGAMDANRHRTNFANDISAVMSILLEHAIDLGWRSDNPAKGTRKLQVPLERRKPHLPWTDDAVALWRAEARPLPLLIFEIGVGTVQRPADWCLFTWEDFDGKALRIVQGKTGTALHLPCTPVLRDALNVVLALPPGEHVVDWPVGPILRKPDGNPISYRTLAWIMLQERQRLGLQAFDLHALRYRGVMELAWAGCSDEEIASFSGHASTAMIRKYAGEARQIMRARQAAEKRG